MADLGDIPVRVGKYYVALWPTPYVSRAHAAVFARPDLNEPEIGIVHFLQYSSGAGVKKLSGTVAGNQTDFTQVIVRAYRKSSGRMAGEVRPKANGAFSVEVDGDPNEFFIIAFDPAGGEDFNAIIFDKVTTV